MPETGKASWFKAMTKLIIRAAETGNLDDPDLHTQIRGMTDKICEDDIIKLRIAVALKLEFLHHSLQEQMEETGQKIDGHNARAGQEYDALLKRILEDIALIHAGICETLREADARQSGQAPPLSATFDKTRENKTKETSHPFEYHRQIGLFLHELLRGPKR